MAAKSYGRLMLDLAGTQLSDSERLILANPQVGGVILFARNFESKQQLMALVESIRCCSSQLLIAVDQEGGRVQRLKQGFTSIPPMQILGDQIISNAKAGMELATDTGWLMASEVIACGIDISFAPVLDVDRDFSSIIGDRAFSDNPEQVILAAKGFIKGMNQAGMAATGKHFPGHGGVVADSHLEAPIDNRSLDELLAKDLKPFVTLADYLGGIMPAHISFPAIDPSSVGFSKFWLHNMLRQTLGFEGVIFSDDLSMKGADVAGDYKNKAQSALNAGCDMILVCNCPQGAQEVLANMQQLEVKGCEKIATMRAKQAVCWKQLEKTERYTKTKKLLQTLTDMGS